MNNSIKVIFSDLFGVLVGPDYSALIDYIKSVTGETKGNIYKHVFDEESMPFIRGEISFEQYFTRVQHKIRKGNDIDPQQFSFFWKKMKIGQMPTADTLLKIKDKYKIYIITNTTTTHIQSISEKFNFINQFDGVITSNIAKAHKPSTKIFNYACNLISIKASEAVFIDDSESNVLSAANLGMITHQYKTYNNFSNFIKNL